MPFGALTAYVSTFLPLLLASPPLSITGQNLVSTLLHQRGACIEPLAAYIGELCGMLGGGGGRGG